MNAKRKRHLSFQYKRRIEQRQIYLAMWFVQRTREIQRARGIDYGTGTTNRDPKTGIRYGVINMNALSPYVWESVETEYIARCPECGEEVTEDIPDEVPEDESDEWYCPCCQKCRDNDSVYGDEPDFSYIDEDGIKAQVDSHNDLFITHSPYYTHAQFCSPCVPGAGHLENPTPHGVRTYCLPRDYFENDVAPYPYYSVETEEEVK